MRIVIVRHGARQDKFDPEWVKYSPTPYDPPLSTDGFSQVDAAGAKIASVLHQLDTARTAAQSPLGTLGARFADSNVVIHSSPFLRCVQTAQYIAKHVKCERIRLDSVFGEWLTPDYFEKSAPPPDDNHTSLSLSSRQWLDSHGSGHLVDNSWPLSELGNSGQYGETYNELRARFCEGLDNLIEFFDPAARSSLATAVNSSGAHSQSSSPSQSPPRGSSLSSKQHPLCPQTRELVARSRSVSFSGSRTIVIVTHGAGCNALVGHLINEPVLKNVALASFVVLEKNITRGGSRLDGIPWTIVSPSADTVSSTASSHLTPPMTPKHGSVDSSPIAQKESIAGGDGPSSSGNTTAATTTTITSTSNTNKLSVPGLSHSPGSSTSDEFAWPAIDGISFSTLSHTNPEAEHSRHTNNPLDPFSAAPMMLSFSKK